MRSFSKRIAWLCLLLTLCSAVALVTHHHSSANDAAKCTVCVAAHSASPQAASVLPKQTLVRAFVFRSKPASAQQRLVAFALSVRPPPAV
ncbi:MAG TPA: hypothetical protein VEU11_02570 [Terriglobales bacterium]|nr:hypothetical protein [Terriglobales bacterium]